MSALAPWTMDYPAKHVCGHPLRLHAEVTRIEASDTKKTDAVEVQMDLAVSSVSYFSGDTLVTHCPGCSQFLPTKEESDE